MRILDAVVERVLGIGLRFANVLFVCVLCVKSGELFVQQVVRPRGGTTGNGRSNHNYIKYL